MTQQTTYKKVNPDIIPISIENVLSVYPHPERFGVPYTYFAHYSLPVELLSKEFVRIVNLGGLDIKHAEVFYRPGSGEEFDAKIHTDGFKMAPGFAKINYVFGGENNIMKWYMPKSDDLDKNLKITRAGTKYLEFEEDEVDKIDEVEMNGLYVVNAGIPHSVSMNRGDYKDPRICVSIVPKNPETGGECHCDYVYARMLLGLSRAGITDDSLFRAEYFKLFNAEFTGDSSIGYIPDFLRT